MAGPEEAVDRHTRRVEDGPDRRHDRDVVAEQREVVDAAPLRLEHRHRGGGHGRLEAEREEHHVAARVRRRDFERVQRRINHAHISAVGARLQQRALGAGHAHRVAKGREDDTGLIRDRHAVVHAAHRQHAHGAARAMHELERGRDQVLQRITKDRVGVAAAHLHDLQRAFTARAQALGRAGNFAQQRARGQRIAEFIDVLHGVLPFGADARAGRSSASRLCTRSHSTW
mmetsp:Transcript_18256/g.43898  ORF Transcript_18256/g.43898 Transcript_18256/m.43898 type:complete len:229 (-) Transcript_18256:65-751(-)